MENKDRDEKGRFIEGNAAGSQFKPSSTDGTATEAGRKGGIASAEAKRERKHWREVLEELLSLPMEIKLPDKTSRQGTINEGLLIGQIQAAMKGNTNAAKFVASMLDEYVEKNETTLKGAQGFVVIASDDEQKELLEKLKQNDA